MLTRIQKPTTSPWTRNIIRRGGRQPRWVCGGDTKMKREQRDMLRPCDSDVQLIQGLWRDWMDGRCVRLRRVWSVVPAAE